MSSKRLAPSLSGLRGLSRLFVFLTLLCSLLFAPFQVSEAYAQGVQQAPDALFRTLEAKGQFSSACLAGGLSPIDRIYCVISQSISASFAGSEWDAVRKIFLSILGVFTAFQLFEILRRNPDPSAWFERLVVIGITFVAATVIIQPTSGDRGLVLRAYQNIEEGMNDVVRSVTGMPGGTTLNATEKVVSQMQSIFNLMNAFKPTEGVPLKQVATGQVEVKCSELSGSAAEMRLKYLYQPTNADGLPTRWQISCLEKLTAEAESDLGGGHITASGLIRELQQNGISGVTLDEATAAINSGQLNGRSINPLQVERLRRYSEEVLAMTEKLEARQEKGEIGIGAATLGVLKTVSALKDMVSGHIDSLKKNPIDMYTGFLISALAIVVMLLNLFLFFVVAVVTAGIAKILVPIGLAFYELTWATATREGGFKSQIVLFLRVFLPFAVLPLTFIILGSVMSAIVGAGSEVVAALPYDTPFFLTQITLLVFSLFVTSVIFAYGFAIVRMTKAFVSLNFEQFLDMAMDVGKLVKYTTAGVGAAAALALAAPSVVQSVGARVGTGLGAVGGKFQALGFDRIGRGLQAAGEGVTNATDQKVVFSTLAAASVAGISDGMFGGAIGRLKDVITGKPPIMRASSAARSANANDLAPGAIGQDLIGSSSAAAPGVSVPPPATTQSASSALGISSATPQQSLSAAAQASVLSDAIMRGAQKAQTKTAGMLAMEQRQIEERLAQLPETPELQARIEESERELRALDAQRDRDGGKSVDVVGRTKAFTEAADRKEAAQKALRERQSLERKYEENGKRLESERNEMQAAVRAGIIEGMQAILPALVQALGGAQSAAAAAGNAGGANDSGASGDSPVAQSDKSAKPLPLRENLRARKDELDDKVKDEQENSGFGGMLRKMIARNRAWALKQYGDMAKQGFTELMGGTEGASAVLGLVNPVTSAVDERFKISERFGSLMSEDTAKVRALKKEHEELEKQLSIEERKARKAKYEATTEAVSQDDERQSKNNLREKKDEPRQVIAESREAPRQQRDEASASGGESDGAVAQAANASAEAAKASAEAAKASANAAKNAGNQPSTKPAKKPNDSDGAF